MTAGYERTQHVDGKAIHMGQREHAHHAVARFGFDVFKTISYV